MTDQSGVHAEAAPAMQRGLIDQPLFDEAQIRRLREALGSEDLRDMLSAFPEAAGQAFRNIGTALASNDLEEGRRRAHAFKGTASSFGAARLASLARAMELEATSITSMMRLMPDLARAIDETLAVLPGIGGAASAEAKV